MTRIIGIPVLIGKATSEYSPLGKVFNKGVDKTDKKEGLLKRLKNIEDKNKEKLKMVEKIERRHLGIKKVINIFDEKPSQK